MKLTQGEQNAMAKIDRLFKRYADETWVSVEGAGIRAATLGNLKAKGLIDVRTSYQPIESWSQARGMTRKPAHEAEVRRMRDNHDTDKEN